MARLDAALAAYPRCWTDFSGRSPRCLAGVGVAAVVTAVSCGAQPKLPEPHSSADLFDICTAAPAPPPTPLLPMGDPGACLPESFSSGVPLQYSVLPSGRAVDVVFYDQCSGETAQLAPGVESCIRSIVSEWRFMEFEGCPGVSGGSVGLTRIYPTEQRAARGTGPPMASLCGA
jgi:hypothetical protein